MQFRLFYLSAERNVVSPPTLKRHLCLVFSKWRRQIARVILTDCMWVVDLCDKSHCNFTEISYDPNHPAAVDELRKCAIYSLPVGHSRGFSYKLNRANWPFVSYSIDQRYPPRDVRPDTDSEVVESNRSVTYRKSAYPASTGLQSTLDRAS